MKYAAEIAVEGMEKSAIEPLTMALIAGGMAVAPTVTRWLNKLTGHSATANVAKAKQLQEQKARQLQAQKLQAQQPQMATAAPPAQIPQAPPMAHPMAQQMMMSARGLHNFRAAQPGMMG